MSDITGYLFIGGGMEELEGYEKDWEYPLEWVQSPQTQMTNELAAIHPEIFEPVFTVFPTPQVPRPKK